MTAITHPGNGTLHRDAIALPMLRPVAKAVSSPSPYLPEVPPVPAVSGESAVPVTPVAKKPSPGPANGSPASAPSSPPTVQSVQKLNLDLLGQGDKVVVRTANSTYNFEIAAHHMCKVVPGKSTARSGEAILMGGTSADATEYTPDRVFVGGRMAYQFPDEDSAILTSVVESIFWVSARKPLVA